MGIRVRTDCENSVYATSSVCHCIQYVFVQFLFFSMGFEIVHVRATSGSILLSFWYIEEKIQLGYSIWKITWYIGDRDLQTDSLIYDLSLSFPFVMIPIPNTQSWLYTYAVTIAGDRDCFKWPERHHYCLRSMSVIHVYTHMYTLADVLIFFVCRLNLRQTFGTVSYTFTYRYRMCYFKL